MTERAYPGLGLRPFETEIIPSEDTVSRFIGSPSRMFDEIAGELLLEDGFLCHFQQDKKTNAPKPVSVTWRKYTKTSEELRSVAIKSWMIPRNIREREKGKRETIYKGFISAVVSKIRELKSSDGSHFEVTHEPIENNRGHSHINLIIVNELTDFKKERLLRRLAHVFSKLDEHD